MHTGIIRMHVQMHVRVCDVIEKFSSYFLKHSCPTQCQGSHLPFTLYNVYRRLQFKLQ